MARNKQTRRRRARRSRPNLWIAALGLILIVLLGPTLLGTVRADVMAGVTLLGTDLGGMRGEDLRQAVAEIARDRGAESITVVSDLPRDRATGELEELVTATSGVGYAFDVDATVSALTQPGRQANPLRAWRDLIRSLSDEIAVDAVDGVDEGALESWAADVVEVLTREPVEGMVELADGEIRVTEPEPGTMVDGDDLVSKARAAALEPGPDTITPTLVPNPAETTTEEVERAAELARHVVSGPVELSRNEGTVELSPEQLSNLVSFEREGGQLTATASAAAVDDLVDEELRSSLERDPESAPITVDSGEVEIGDSHDGFRFDAEVASEQILDLATSEGSRSATLEGETVLPERSREDAEALGITEEVSSFTTHYTEGQGRNTNIQRIADLVDGVVIEPGETFSVNDHVGERTEEKGFVPGGAILRGEFVDQVGGGVSQFATTLYNAAYFGGYEIPEHQAHSYYIERYPAGREATLNYPTIDLKIRNNSPYGMMLDMSHTSSSVTASIWGTRWVEVESVAGERTREREGELRDGFDIVVTRVLRFPDGSEEREEQFTRYLPEDEPAEDS